MGKKKALVVGAGIVGMAVARALSLKGYKVAVYERNARAVGASVRNFGMVWPVGQPKGKLYNRAMRTREIWKEICDEAGIWYNPSGSLHLLYHDDEMAVAQEFADQEKDTRACEMLSPEQALSKTSAANPEGLKGALWSTTELIVESRDAIGQVAKFLEEKYEIKFHFGSAVQRVKEEKAYVGGKKVEADIIVVCSGSDFESLFPDVYAQSGMTKCKLQMMRTVPQPGDWDIGPSLCGGLTLTHYAAFADMPTLPTLKERYAQDWPEQVKWGVHVLVSQSPRMELTLGDSHEYGQVFDPFCRESVNKLILDYLQTFTRMKSLDISQTWIGEYAKLPGQTEYLHSPDDGVFIVNGLSGAGMTLSFGLAEEWVATL